MSKFAQPVSMYCPSKEDYERDLQQPILDLGYEESEACNVIHDDNYVFATWSNRFGFAQKKSDVFNKSHHIPTWNPTLAIAIAAMRVGEEIHVGEYVKITGKQSAESLALDGQIKRVKAVSKHGLSKFGNGNLDVYDGIGGGIHLNEVRKATLQELIDKFGEKEPADVPFVPKRGDVVYCDNNEGGNNYPLIWIVIHSRRIGLEDHNIANLTLSDNTLKLCWDWTHPLFSRRLATDSEKQLLFDALKKAGKRYNAEKFCIEDIPAETEKNERPPAIKEARQEAERRIELAKQINNPTANPHQSMIDEWEESGRTKKVEMKLRNTWYCASAPTWDSQIKYRFKPEEPKESVPARPLMVKATSDSKDGEFKKDGVYAVAKSDGGYNELYGYSFHAIGESGEAKYCMERGCAYMNYGDWIVIQREGEPEPKQEQVSFWLSDTPNGFQFSLDKPLTISELAKLCAHSLADETTDFKEAFRLLELVRQELEQIRQDTIATKTKERDKLTAEIKKLKQSQNK